MTRRAGFDAILDNPNIAGGSFSFWNRQGIRLAQTGVALVGRSSIMPSLRSSKTEGQASFVNPGVFLYNVGLDAELTPKLRTTLNVSYMRFQNTTTLRRVLFQDTVSQGHRSRLQPRRAVSSMAERQRDHHRRRVGVHARRRFQEHPDEKTCCTRRLCSLRSRTERVRLTIDERRQMFRVRKQARVVVGAALIFGGTLAAATLDVPSAARARAAGRDPPGDVRVAEQPRRGSAARLPRRRSPEIAAEIERQIAAGNGCLTCHQPDTLSMHELEKQITCVECHGGNAKEPWNPANPRERVPAALGPDSPRCAREWSGRTSCPADATSGSLRRTRSVPAWHR